MNLAYDDSQMVSYANSELKAIFYYRHDNGLWGELEIASGLISSFSFDDHGDLLYNGRSLHTLKDQCEQRYIKELEMCRLAWEKEQERRRIEQARRQKEAEQRQQEYVAQYKERQDLAAELERRRKEQIEAERQARKEREEINKERIREKIDASIDLDQENPFRDSDGNRWIRCEYCGRLSTEEDFVSYGGNHHVNLGTCKECNRKQDISVLPKYAVKSTPKIVPATMKQDSMICPECGNKLIKRNGRYGAFLGCSSFPKCRYSRKI